MATGMVLLGQRRWEPWMLDSTTTAARVQAVLDTYGVAVLLPGIHSWDTRVNLPDNAKLFGFGSRVTMVRWTGAGHYALRFGAGSNGNYCAIEGVLFTNSTGNPTERDAGGIEVYAIGRASFMRDTGVFFAEEHGFDFTNANGEGLHCEDCDSYGAANDGLHLTAAAGGGYTGSITWRNGSLSNNAGYGVNGSGVLGDHEVNDVKFDGTLIQGNWKTDGAIGPPAAYLADPVTYPPAEMRLDGLISQVKLAGTWMEPATGVTRAKHGLVLQNEGAGARAPGQVIVDDHCTFNNYYPWTASGYCPILVKASNRPIRIEVVEINGYWQGIPGVDADAGSTLRYKLNTKAQVPLGDRVNINAMYGAVGGEAGAWTPPTDWIVLDGTI